MRFISFLFDVCLFRAGPEDAPPGTTWTLLAALLYLGVGLWSFSAIDRAIPPLLPTLQSMAVLSAGVAIVLGASQQLPRLPQSLTTLFGTSALINVLATAVTELGVTGEQISAPAALTILVLFFWGLGIDGHIFRRALDSGFGTGLVVAVMLFAINQGLLLLWLPGGA